MSEKQPVKVKRFYGVRLLSVLLKVLAIITVLVSLGALGYAAIEFIGLPTYLKTENPRFTGVWQLFNYMLGLVVGGSLISIALYGISQILDVLLSISDSLRTLARGDEVQLSADKGLHASNLSLAHEVKQLKEAVERLSRVQRLQANPQSQAVSDESRPVPPQAASSSNLP